jgi:hypothetical protein
MPVIRHFTFHLGAECFVRLVTRSLEGLWSRLRRKQPERTSNEIGDVGLWSLLVAWGERYLFDVSAG